jgi:hypothetical protein
MKIRDNLDALFPRMREALERFRDFLQDARS